MTVIGKLISLPLKLKVQLILFPISLLYMLPIAWGKSLWQARILLKGNWSRYMGFNPVNAVNSLFYKTQWINLHRYGRNANSPIIGLGNYPLKNWFHLSGLASYLYTNAGALTTLVGTLVWAFSHLIWLEVSETWWSVAVVAVLFLSTTAYAMAFARQNYQILGWMFLPPALFFTWQGDYIPAAITWFAAGLGGITHVFFAVPIVLLIVLINGDFYLGLTLTPALIIVAIRFLPFLSKGGTVQAIKNTLKLIGTTQNEVRYKRDINSVSIFTIYLSLLYLFSTILLSFSIREIAILPLFGLFLFVINQCIFRVADQESLIMIIISLFALTALNAEPNTITIIALWCAVNPLGYFLSIQKRDKDSGFSSILVNPPFDHMELEKGLRAFLEPVRSGERVYFAFNDPQGRYNNVFDGYRVIHELPLQISSEKGIHLFPDWWAVAETNYEGSPQCWGRNHSEVLENCSRWHANYAIIYLSTGMDLSSKWNTNFELIGEFDWSDYLQYLRGVKLWPKSHSTPKWFLLKLKK
tara:strand:+ start:1798 stop:3375 length:1578 start_codon:yes stop_codon:yes gene_type:complete